MLRKNVNVWKLMMVMIGAERLRVRIKTKAYKTDTTVGVCYRPRNQDGEVDKTLYRQLGEVSRSLPLVLLGTSTSQTSAGFIIQHIRNSTRGS